MPVYVTWNMEGSGGGSKVNSWTNMVFFHKQRADVICLQECGGVPKGAVKAARPWADDPVGGAGGVDCYMVRRGTKDYGEEYYLSYYHWDGVLSKAGKKRTAQQMAEEEPNAGRVNFATLTKVRPEKPAAGRPAAFIAGAGEVSRGLLCVMLPGKIMVASIHAASGQQRLEGGSCGNTRLLINKAAEIGAQVAAKSVYILGDFNCDPRTPVRGGPRVDLRRQSATVPQLPLGYRLIPPDRPTRWSTQRKLDYLVGTGLEGLPPAAEGQVLGVFNSDHCPVVYTLQP